MTVSIIIAVKTWQKNLEECVSRCLELTGCNFEILILPDESFPSSLNNSRIKIIPTGKASPPQKRDLGARSARGEILAFLDDDAYPAKDWLVWAIRLFKEDKEVGCVCGPAVTPDTDSRRQKASGLIYSSILVSANHAFRYVPRKKRIVFDYPSCNFFIKKDIFDKVGGFSINFWPGEDTFLCLKVTSLNKKIIYHPHVLVYHHRRPLFRPHLRQIASYALHRGYFAKRYPKTSLKIAYFVPTIFLFAIVTGSVLSMFFASLRIIYLLGLFLYLLLVLIFSISKELRLIPLVFPGIILTHLSYGCYFIKGLVSQRMPEE